MVGILNERANTRSSLLSAVAGIVLFPAAALAQEAPPENEEIERTRRGDEIIVTARSLSTPTAPSPLPVQILSGDELAHRRQGGLGETLAGLPGIHLDNFGGGASRPVIRGQTVPRIEILSDGANLFDASSVSPDHAITTEPLLLDAIEILRGPAATRYGGNAVNGAINLIDSKVPKALPEGGLSGATEVRFGTGDEEKTIAGRVTAGLGPFAIHAEGSRRRSDDYAVPDAYGSDELRDSFANSSSYSFGASWVTSKGYIGAAYTRQDGEYGLPGHSHINGVCHTHGTDLHCAAHDEFDDPFGSSDDHTAYIKLRSERADVRADYEDLLPGFEHVRLRGSFTDYRHDEIDGPSLFSHYTNEVYDGRLELTHKPLLGFIGTLGAQYTYGTFTGINISDAHILPLGERIGYTWATPEYVTENIGVFLSERRSFGAFDVEIAARKDWRTVKTPLPEYRLPTSQTLLNAIAGFDQRNGEGAFQARAKTAFENLHPRSKHTPFSVSFGTTWRIDNDYSIALSLARTERAPSVRELYAYGNNLATNSYEVGLAQTRRASSSFPEARTDVLETAKSVNLTFRKTGGPFEFEIGLFHQDIDDYVFARLIETEIETGVPHHYLVYTAADARFTGIDGQVSYRFTPESSVTVFGDYVHADLKKEDDNLPRIPPGRLGARYEGNWGPLSADLEYYHTFGQDRIASYETRTGGYDILNATLSYRFDVGADKSVELYVRGTNLANELAFSHTSFVKDQSPLRGRNIVFGMRHVF